jgi:hypothetical protein
LTSTAGEIEQAGSPLFEISRQLARIAGAGKFATRRTAAANDLDLEVRGVGRIRFPITPGSARKLCAIARPARHGFKDETRLDKRVRDTWEIAKARISIDQPRWSKTMAPQLERIGKDLGLPAGSRLKAELHNLLVYAPGQFFAPHQDSEKADNMIGTLTVSLPSRFTGGIMSIEHRGAKLRVGGSDSRLTFAAFYADCHHEVLPVKEGYRVVLTYNLTVEGNAAVGAAGSANIKVLVQSIREFFTKPVKARWKGDSRREQPPDRLVYLLDHEYTQRGLQWNRLKSVDAPRAAALRAVAAELDCEIFLALADVHETWACEEEDSGYSHYAAKGFGDYDDDDEDEVDEEGGDGALDQSPDFNLTEFIERDVELRHWVGLTGRGEAVTARVDDSELCFTKPSEDLEPFESEHEGYMGNYGNTVEHWYHRAAVVLWPRERTFVIRAKASPQWGIAEIAKAVRARKSSAAVGMAQRLAPFWSHVAGRTEKPALFAATLNVAAKLKDATTAATLLQPFGLTALAGKVALGLTDLLDAYGIEWCRAIIQDWESQEENELPKGRLAWMESTLAILCRALSETPSGRELAGWVLTKQWEFILDRSRQISKYASAKDIAREMGSLCKPILCVIESSRATRQPDLSVRLVAFLTSHTSELPVQVPMGVLRRAKQDHARTTRKTWDFRSVHAHCWRVINARLNQPNRANNDWSIQTPIRCSCRLCAALTQFLSAADKVHFEWPLAKDQRAHIHRAIDRHDLPVTHVTRRTGRPFTLVLEKTAALFKRDAAERQSLREDLEWLQKTAAEF